MAVKPSPRRFLPPGANVSFPAPSRHTLERVPMQAVKAEHKGHWFDRSSMRFFDTRLPREAVRGPGGTFFTSSERSPGGDRRYSVRQVLGEGKIETVGDFHSITRRQAAVRQARRLAIGRR